MSPRVLIGGALLSGIVLFAWGALVHTVLPIEAVKEFKDGKAVVQAIRANAPDNGVYFAGEGVVAAVSLRPDLSGEIPIGPPLAREVVLDLLEGLLLVVVLLMVPRSTRFGKVGVACAAALAACIAGVLPEWNWYGFSTPFALVECLDLVGGWCLAALALTPLIDRLASPTPAARLAPAL